jgi:hypothetical protein
MSEPRIGGIMQVAYVVEDIDQAIEQWVRTLGVGPFFVARHAAYKEFSYREGTAPPDVSLAFAYSGDTNIELVQQHDQTPSAFLDFLRARGPGVQHVGVLSDDIGADTRLLEARGAGVVQRLVNAANGVETRFFDTELHPGAMLELIQRSPALDAGFAFMKRAAQNWDGKIAIAG